MAVVQDCNPYAHLVKTLKVGNEDFKYFDLKDLKDNRYDKLPYSIRVLLEAAVRCCDNFQVKEKDVTNILDWEKQQWNETEVAFKPARVILQDFTGVPAVVDFAAMRDAVKTLGGNPDKINPLCPADLVIDHSVQVDFSRSTLNKSPNPGGGDSSKIPAQVPPGKPQVLPAICNDCVRSGGKCQMALALRQSHPALPLLTSATLNRNPLNTSGSLSESEQSPAPFSWRKHAGSSKPEAPSTEITNSSRQSLCGSTKLSSSVIKAQQVVCPFHQQWLARGDALQKNQDIEFERNKERFLFLKWGSKAFQNMMIVPPGSGICHQVNLEYLARVVFKQDNFLYPDSLVGADSHTTMINGLGIVGWGVGGIEAEAVMLGQAISMVLPKVVGYKLYGKLDSLATSTDVVLTITKHLRQVGVVNKFVEFFGPGVAELSIADRATISNMCPEYGATIGFFPVDSKSLDYLVQSGRDETLVTYVEAYLRAVNMFRDFNKPCDEPSYSEIVELDLSQVVPSMSGPKRPQDRVPVSEMKKDFAECLHNKVGFKGFNIPDEQAAVTIPFVFEGQEYILQHGSVVIAAITSCTNTSNPSVMLGAGLLAKKAVEKGLSVGSFVKTSLSPGSGVVTHYLQESGVTPYLQQLGFDVVGYGCMTCIGNSGPLPDVVINAIEKGDLVAVSVLSGNRNFEGRVHPHTRANYLASPLLVVAYALAGRVDIDFESTPIGRGNDGQDVYLRDIWPSRNEIQEVENQFVIPALFLKVYAKIQNGNESWNSLDAPESMLYPWDESSTYIKSPPFFKNMSQELPPRGDIVNAHVLVHLGDFVTTDHISPAGSIARNSSAARYLSARGLTPREFNSYGSRRGNDAVMARGTFANIRLLNKFIGKAGARTLHIPSGQEMDVFDAAERYQSEGTTLIILAGKDYGCGSSRDWAAKGPMLLGVKAVIAESYERIHRSNLVGMGIIPLEYMPGQNAESLGLTGKETYTVNIPKTLIPKMTTTVQVDNGKNFSVVIRFDTEVELTYFENGGILQYMVRRMLK